MAVTIESVAADLAGHMQAIGAAHEVAAAPLREALGKAKAAQDSFRFGLGEPGGARTPRGSGVTSSP